MIVGLPGTGIGGLFYALMSVYLPLRTAGAKLRKKSRITPWTSIFRQVLLALIIAGTMWLTGEVVGRLVALITASHQGSGGVAELLDPKTIASGQYNMLKLAFIYWTFAVMLSIQILMQALRLIVRMSRSFAR